MEDIGKALIMAAQVLMFAFAATIAIYLYSTLTTRADNVMLTDNYSNRGDAIVGIEDEDNERTVKRAEIVMAILDLKTKYEKTGEQRGKYHPECSRNICVDFQHPQDFKARCDLKQRQCGKTLPVKFPFQMPQCAPRRENTAE